MSDKLVTRVNGNDIKVSSTSGLFTKTQCDSDIENHEKIMKVLIKRYLLPVD